MHAKSFIEIDKNALKKNLKNLRKSTREQRICAVVKANAYGHGLRQIVGLLKNKVDWFAVDNLNEAMILKDLEVKENILILGYTPLALIKETIKNGFSFVIYNRESVSKIGSLKLSKKAKVHLKIETGLNRQGIRPSEVQKYCEYLGKFKKYLILEGIYSHFANIDGAIDTSFAEKQFTRFNLSKKIVERAGYKPFAHLSASSASLVFPKAKMDMLRLGISLYGIWPSQQVKKAVENKLKLKPVLTWKSIVAQVKNVKKGESVSYGRMWFAKKDTKVAVVPIGYSDGFDRKLSNKGSVLIKGNYALVLGRVAMNMIVVDVSKIKNVKVEDEVVIIGKQGKREISARDIAEKIDTIPYEIVARLNSFIDRAIV